MGTSINVKGTLAANVDYLTRLYKTKLSISNGDKLQLVFKGATASTIQVKLGVAENNNEFTTFNLGSTTTVGMWLQ
jgi:endo-beta-N-acetylglucosaminidase D